MNKYTCGNGKTHEFDGARAGCQFCEVEALQAETQRLKGIEVAAQAVVDSKHTNVMPDNNIETSVSNACSM